MAIMIKKVIVDEHTGGYVADVVDDQDVRIGEIDVLEIPASDGVPRRRLWTVKDLNGNRIGEGEF